jgi:hypothetical protein
MRRELVDDDGIVERAFCAELVVRPAIALSDSALSSEPRGSLVLGAERRRGSVDEIEKANPSSSYQ